uniref:Uncharacterized protein n=1 Tax=viral metagenome TaxID=1070528 RepID=A0A6C0F3Q2_9ZZZZ
MSENTRSINIDLNAFKIPSGGKTIKNREPAAEKKIKVRTPPKTQNKSLKKNLLKFIRNQQDRKLKSENLDPPEELDFKSDFSESLEYLSDIAKKNDVPKISLNKTLKNYLPQTMEPPVILTNLMDNLEVVNIPPVHNAMPTFSLPQPQYGCLKGGKLPLYKQYTRRQYEGTAPAPALAPIHVPVLAQAQAQAQVKEQMDLAAPSLAPTSNVKRDIIQKTAEHINITDLYKPPVPKKQRKTLRRTFKIGKSQNTPRVSVLISNRTIRNNISNKSQSLKLTPIAEVKKYLVKNGFIKVGSIAPNDVLRKMYETAMLACGEIHNYNPENLVYNYFNNIV